MEVFYDRKNDVVSVYFDEEEETNLKGEENCEAVLPHKNFEVEEAAELILDMVDLVDKKGSLKGFRVFNASRHYDSGLLDCAEYEELSGEEVIRKPTEKVVAKIGKGKI